MSGKKPFEIWQGQTKNTTITVYKEDGTVQNLVGATIELEVKPNVGDLDPLLVVGKYTGSGITHLDQTVGADTEGQAVIAWVPADTAGVTPKQYTYDIVVILPDTTRFYVVAPSPFFIHAVVNQA